MIAHADLEPATLLDGIPEGDYHSWPFVSSGLLNRHRISPAHAKHYLDRKETTTDAKEFGSACHVAVLEPDTFAARVLCEPTNPDGSDMDRRTKAYKEARAASEAANPGVLILKPTDYRAVLAIRDAIWTGRTTDAVEARRILKRCDRREASAVWVDPRTGQMCKMRPDLAGDDIAADLKMVKDGGMRGMFRACKEYGHHVQQAHYSIGLAECGAAAGDYPYIVVDHTDPIEVFVWRFDSETQAKSRALWERLMDKHAACVRTNEWPTRSGGCLALPAWVLGDDSQPEDESGDTEDVTL